MSLMENSLNLVGYNTKLLRLPAFGLSGFTGIVQSGGEMYEAVRNDGRWDVLRNIGQGNNTIYGVASLDKECPKDHYRYTFGINIPICEFEENHQYTDLFSMHIPESQWIIFEIDHFVFQYGKFWQDNPYEMIHKLGLAFNNSAGLHIDVYQPDYVMDEDHMEFWMPVKQSEKVNPE